MKTAVSLFTVLACLLAFYSCRKTEEKHITQNNDIQSIEISLSADEHPELNFEFSGEERAVQDFSVDNGNVYILQSDGVVFRYNRDGTLEEQYDLKLADSGLTAFRISCGNGNMYLLDGHNNAIITAKENQVTNVSTLGFSDVGVVKNYCVADDGAPLLSFFDFDGPFTAKIDPTGDEVKIVGEKTPGYLIDRNATYLPEITESEEGLAQVAVTVYKQGESPEQFIIGSNSPDRSMAGLSVYDLDGDTLIGLLHEFVNTADGEQYVQTMVAINTKDGKIQVSDSHFDGDEIFELSSDGTYCMKQSDNTLSIKPVRAYFTDWEESDLYFLQIK